MAGIDISAGQPAQSARSPLSDIYFLADKRKIALLKLFKRVKTRRYIDRQTLAFIAGESDAEPKALAISGWVAKQIPDTCVLDSLGYTARVRDFGKMVGFKFPHSCWDTSNGEACYPEICGRYFACHCEKKLALFWLHRQMRHVLGVVDYSQIGLLKTAPLPTYRRNALVYLDHRPCSNCRGFIRLIEQLSGLTFTILSRPALQLGRREKAKFCQHCACDGCRKKKTAQQWGTVYDRTGGGDDAEDQDQLGRARTQSRRDEQVSVIADAEEDQEIDETTGATDVPVITKQTIRRVHFPALTPPRVLFQSSVPQDWSIRPNNAAKPLPATPVLTAPGFFGQQYAESAAYSCSKQKDTILHSIEDDDMESEPSPSVIRLRQLPLQRPEQSAKVPDLSAFSYTGDEGVSQLAARLHRSSLSGEESVDPLSLPAKPKATKRPVAHRRFQKSLLPGLVRRN